jgi:hypothetical protein
MSRNRQIQRVLQQISHFDAGESAFLTRELLAMEAQAYDIKYAPRTWEQFIPADTSVPAGAEQTQFTMYDRVGTAAVGGRYSDDAPRVDVFLKEYLAPVLPVKAAFGYNLQELRAAAMARRPLDSAKAMAGRESVEDQIDRLGWLGDTASGTTGLANCADIASSAVITGNWSTTATGDQILADLNKLVSDVYTVSKQVFMADSIAMSPADYMIVSQKPRATGTDRTVLEAFLAANPSIKFVGATHRLTTAGAGSTKRVIAYVRRPDILQLPLPVRFETLPAQERNFEFVVPCHGRVGQLKMRYPLAARYMDATG